MYYQHILHRFKAEIEANISAEFNRVGLLYRIFGRVKSLYSIQHKMSRKGTDYSPTGKKMQDLIGVRVAVYFADDAELAQNILNSMYSVIPKSCTIDLPDKNTFGPTRFNLVFRTPTELVKPEEFKDLIDDTFEVQLRTILSEGWHEVEHDMRYKVKKDWEPSSDLYRSLNGIVATLETCDWSMLQIFDRLAYTNYSAKNWNAMIRAKFRLRFQNDSLGRGLQNVFSVNSHIAKLIFKCKRNDALLALHTKKLEMPIVYDNIIYLINRLFLNEKCISDLEPDPIKELFENGFKF